jgi:DNA-binding response OmpR family regulator
MSEGANTSAEKIPNVYFIDDSATMREVIKIAFRRESINVIACHDAASALERFSEAAPDAVITDVIMPGKDGYEVCQFIKNDVNLAKTPVILMSGVVDRGVAEKAIAAKADELIRKPFQPQELIARVKNLLSPRPSAANPDQETAKKDIAPAASLSGIFAMPAVTAPLPRPATPSASSADIPAASFAPPRASGNSAELQKLRFEIQRLEMLVKKLQSELEAERQYVASLESHMRTLQETE